MTHHEVIRSAEHERMTANARAKRVAALSATLGVLANGVVVVVMALFAAAVSSGTSFYVTMGILSTVGVAPAAFLLFRKSIREQEHGNAVAANLESQLTEAVLVAEQEAERRATQVRRQEFETRLANALEMAQEEDEVLDAVERALSSTLPAQPAEVLLADNSHAHLTRMAASTPTGEASGCPVDSPDNCPAARRAQVQQFTDSEAIDSCPKLRNRERGRCSAVCVPVSIMGRTVGVIHATGEVGAVVDDATVADLSTLSKLAGARIGLLRVMAETQLQAATDSLTGLLNRRSLENKMRVKRAEKADLVVAMADLDHFKDLNDTHGHETGDRALRLFAQVLRASLRSDDMVSRYGGEEFALVLPSCTVEDGRTRLNHVRETLKAAVAKAGLPQFTVSFGLVEAGDNDDDIADVLARADTALFEAKRLGRDRVVVHDAHGKTIAGRGGRGPGSRRTVNAETNGRSKRGGSTNGNGRTPASVTVLRSPTAS